MKKEIFIEISARHIHLCRKDVYRLFGKGYEIKRYKELSQPSDYAAKEVVSITIDNKKKLKFRVVGPLRDDTQIEMSVTDIISLGGRIPEGIFGNTFKFPEVTIIGPKGKVRIKNVRVFSQRHIHCSPEEAKSLGLKNKDIVSVKVDGEKSVIFNNVLIKVHPNFRLAMHLDTDEGNGAGISRKAYGYLV